MCYNINDIEQYLEDNGVESLDMINEVSFEVLDINHKIFLLLYADDAVLISENVDGMQTMLNVFSVLCLLCKFFFAFRKLLLKLRSIPK
jgi:hypothetical protein